LVATVVVLSPAPVVTRAAFVAGLEHTDRAHFVREVTAMFGESPAAYAARYATRGLRLL
jgi:hypothetical protein